MENAFFLTIFALSSKIPKWVYGWLPNQGECLDRLLFACAEKTQAVCQWQELLDVGLLVQPSSTSASASHWSLGSSFSPWKNTKASLSNSCTLLQSCKIYIEGDREDMERVTNVFCKCAKNIQMLTIVCYRIKKMQVWKIIVLANFALPSKNFKMSIWWLLNQGECLDGVLLASAA